MSEEFALQWNNFSDNIASGLQNLLFKNDFLCDVTLAVQGKFLRAHKIVLAICSSYFQEMFLQHQHQHPIIIMNDMDAKLVCNLLEFMYKGVVNVKQSELQNFMKIAETLHIKGLTTKEPTHELKKSDQKSGLKRRREETVDESTPNQREKEQKTEIDPEVTDLTADDEAADDQFEMVPMPEISMIESRFHSTKSRDSNDSGSFKMSGAQSMHNFTSCDFNNDSNEHPKSSQLAGEQLKNEVPSSGSSITMLSSTSLLHGSCVFNRNNTVATQAGLKTYWLCKSYRISMCKARCITHQGKVISATGIHNHLPHMNKQHEIPPGYTPNPPTNQDYQMPILNPILHSPIQLAPNNQLQQPYYLDQIPSLTTSDNNQVQFKIEHL